MGLWHRTLAMAALIATAAAYPASARAETFRFEYGASLFSVVSLGEMQLSGTIDARGYTARTALRTSGFARLFDDTQLDGVASGGVSGGVSGGALLWSRYALQHAYAKKFRRVAMERGARGVVSVITPKFGAMGAPPATPAQQTASFDPITGVIAMARSVGARDTCSGVFPIFDGRQHYRLTLSPRARGRYAGGGYAGAALVCRLRYEPVSGFKPMTPEERARIPEGEIWFATPAQRGLAAPLRITAPTPVGELRIDIKRLEIRP